MPEFATARGMRDFLPEEARKMRHVEDLSRELARLYGYEEIITPAIESYELLAAKSGDEIRQRMFAFNDLGGRRMALRPEFTASIARLVATKMMRKPKPLRLFCLGSLYRYDEPQFGRYREFWQVDYELVGSKRPEADAEILAITYDLVERLDLRNFYFKIGHMGILRGILSQEGVAEEQQGVIMQLLDKKRWNEALTVIQESGVPQECVATIKNVLETSGKDVHKVLRDAKRNVEKYEGAVAAVENLQEILELVQGGVGLEPLVEAGFARGLEYYTGMIFEVYVPEMEVALGGGGRYDKLIELFGGEPTPAVGVAQGTDRLVLAMEKQGIAEEVSKEKWVTILAVDNELKPKAFELSAMLRKAGIPAEVDVMGRTFSKALSDANKRGFTHAIIVGPEELKEGKVVLRNMKEREQRTVTMEALIKEI